MFFGGSDAEGNNMFTVESVNVADFTLLLNVSHRLAPITRDTVGILLELAHRFEFKMTLDRLEKFLMVNDFEYEDLERFIRNIRWAKKYKLHTLKYKCVQMEFSLETLTEMKSSKHWKDLDGETAREIVEAVVKTHRKRALDDSPLDENQLNVLNHLPDLTQLPTQPPYAVGHPVQPAFGGQQQQMMQQQ
ncbi:hypothetical protein PFISCL1PPCAC_19033, partial [Pristionchus fissidentatus]